VAAKRRCSGSPLLLAVAADHTVFSHEQQTIWLGGAHPRVARVLGRSFCLSLIQRRYFSPLLGEGRHADWYFDNHHHRLSCRCVRWRDGYTAVGTSPCFRVQFWKIHRNPRCQNTALAWRRIVLDLYLSNFTVYGCCEVFLKRSSPLGSAASGFQVIATLFAIGGGLLVHRRVDVPARSALRRLPDRMMHHMPGRVTALLGARRSQ